MKKDKIVLVVTHNIYLTDSQRRSLVEGKTISVTGVSLPVWFLTESAKTSEPASEIFCNYRIRSTGKRTSLVKILKRGYGISLPSSPEATQPNINNDVWRQLSNTERETWYDNRSFAPSVKNLQDLKSGGSEYLRLEEVKRTMLESGELAMIIHALEIKTMKALESSIIGEYGNIY